MHTSIRHRRTCAIDSTIATVHPIRMNQTVTHTWCGAARATTATNDEADARAFRGSDDAPQVARARRCASWTSMVVPEVHVVVPGETLCAIARRHAHEGVTVTSLMEANRGVIRHPDRLVAGTRIRMRGDVVKTKPPPKAVREQVPGAWMALGCATVGAGALVQWKRMQLTQLRRDEEERLRLDREKQKTHWMRALVAEPGVVRKYPDEETESKEDEDETEPTQEERNEMQRRYRTFMKQTKADTSQMALPGKDNEYADSEERKYFT